MKTGIATTLSVAGVLAAGAAAFAVNTAVLGPNTPAAAAVTTAPTISASTLPTSSNISPVQNNSAVRATSTQTSTYKVGEAGRVIVEVTNNQLRVANVLPAATWSARSPEYDDGEVEVEFFREGTKVEFKARLVNGSVKVFVESEDQSRDDSYKEEYRHDNDHDDDDDHDDDHDDHEDDD